jgi:hypothetical protein
VFDLTALQSLNINISPDYAVHSKFSRLQRLTSLTLWLIGEVKVDLQSLFWTALTHLSFLELPKEIDKGLVNATKRLMPAVQVVWSGGHQQKFI